jgi:hypothetical protein
MLADMRRSPEPRRCCICDAKEKPGMDFLAHERACIQADQKRAMGPDHSRTGIFVNHNCAGCRDGALPCKQGSPNLCDNPRARND